MFRRSRQISSCPDTTFPPIGPFSPGVRLRVRGIVTTITTKTGYQEREVPVILLTNIVALTCGTVFGRQWFSFGRGLARLAPALGDELELDVRIQTHGDRLRGPRAHEQPDEVYRLLRPTNIARVDRTAPSTTTEPAQQPAYVPGVNMMKIEMWATETLRPHPKNSYIYGDTADEKLVDDIRRRGILEPLAILRDGTVVGGNRRLAAGQQLGMTEVPVIVLDANGALDDLDVVETLLALNQQRLKSAEQLGREGEVRQDIEAERARRRQADAAAATTAARKGTDQASPSLVAKSPQATRSTRGRARAKVAAALGVGEKKAEQARRVVNAVDRLREQGKGVEAEQLREMLNNTSVSKAYKYAVKSGYITLRSRRKQATAAAASDSARPTAFRRPDYVGPRYAFLYAEPRWPSASVTDPEYAEQLAGCVDKITRALATPAVADEAVFFLLVSNRMLADGMNVINSSPFAYLMSITVERVLRSTLPPAEHHSLLLIATAGTSPPQINLASSVLEVEEGPAEKQHTVRDMVEQLAGSAPVLQLAGERLRDGWATLDDLAADDHITPVSA